MSTVANFSQDELGEYTTTIGNMILSPLTPKATLFFSAYVENMIIQVVKENELIDLGALLLMACHKNNEYLVMSLLKLGASMESQSLTLATPIMYIAQQGNLNMLRYFIENGANVLAKSEQGHDVLAYAKAQDVRAYLSAILEEKRKTHVMIEQENQKLKEQLALLQAHANQINPQEYMALKNQLETLQQQLAQAHPFVDDMDNRRKIRKAAEVEMEG